MSALTYTPSLASSTPSAFKLVTFAVRVLPTTVLKSPSPAATTVRAALLSATPDDKVPANSVPATSDCFVIFALVLSTEAVGPITVIEFGPAAVAVTI